MGSRYVNSFNDFGRHWQVTVQADGTYRNRVEDLNLFQVRNKFGQMVLLGTLVHPREIAGPIAVPRYNLYAAASVSGNIQTGTSTGDAIKTIDKIAAETLPLSMKADWTELMFMQKRVGDTSIYVFFLAIVSVFLALSALYESWSLPLAVILVVPLCLLCSVAGVLFTQRDVNIFVQIGLVVLVGLACKNAILVVEYAKQLHLEGRSAFEATKEASRLRLRPILMTSFAFIFGVIPLMIASGAGAEMRRSLGVAVFSGMFGVTLVRHLPHAGVLLRHYRAGRVPPVRFRRFPTACLLLPGRLPWVGGRLPAGETRRRSSSLVGPGRRLRRRARGAGDSGDPSENQAPSWPHPMPTFLLPLPRSNPMEDRTRDPLLCRSSHLLHGHLRRFRAGGRSGRVHAAHGPVPGGHAADRAGDGPLSGRQRLDRARHRGGADRGAGQRRRGHGLHVVALARTTAPTT